METPSGMKLAPITTSYPQVAPGKTLFRVYFNLYENTPFDKDQARVSASSFLDSPGQIVRALG
jgi:hypothetical protein